MKALLLSCLLIICKSSGILHIKEPAKNYIFETPYSIDIKLNVGKLKIIKLSFLGKQLTYIPLEAGYGSFIKEIYKVALNESYIFVSVYPVLLQFDKVGRFIKQIGASGRGPGEYSMVTDFCLDNDRKEVIIISMGRVLFFGFDGKFRRSINLSFRPTQVLLRDQNSLMYYLHNSPVPRDIKPDSWIVTDLQGRILNRFPNTLIRYNTPGLGISQSPFYQLNNAVRLMEFGVDTLYQLKGTIKMPYAIFDLGKFKMEPDPYLGGKDHQKDRDKYFSKLRIYNIIEDERNMYISCHWGLSDSLMAVVYDKRTGITSVLKGNAFKNDIDGSQDFWPDQIVNENVLVSHVDAIDLIKKPLPSPLRGKIDESSNPILILLK